MSTWQLLGCYVCLLLRAEHSAGRTFVKTGFESFSCEFEKIYILLFYCSGKNLSSSRLQLSGPNIQVGRATGAPQWDIYSPVIASQPHLKSCISVNMAPRDELHKAKSFIFQFWSSHHLICFIISSHIYQDIVIADSKSPNFRLLWLHFAPHLPFKQNCTIFDQIA